MSAPAETTMPATADLVEAIGARRPACTSAPIRRPGGRPERDERQGEAVDELAAAQARIAELEQRLADLHARNRELAVDLDNALDQLAGHALHAEQERLVHTPVNAFDTAERWGGYDR